MKSWKCIICGNFKSHNERVAHVFCSNECREIAKIKKCRYCNIEFKADRLSGRVCNSCKNDKNSLARKKYALHLKPKPCKNCGQLFNGRLHQLLCTVCKSILPNPLIHHYNWIERPIICLKCNTECGKEKIKNSFKTTDKTYIKICGECKRKKKLSKDLKTLDEVIRLEKIKFQQRLTKKEAYEKKILGLQRKIISVEDEKLKQQIKSRQQYEKKQLSLTKTFSVDRETLDVIKKANKAALSKRMRENNPMFRKDVIKKVKNTFQRKIKSGELVYKKGKDHHLYKGNRGFAGECRKWLKIWRGSVLERDSFTCVGCNIKGSEFHIHHVRPLREIIEKVLTENKIFDIVNVKNTDLVLYEKLIQQVVDNHTLSDGITVCKQCHADIDSRYRRIKKRIIKNEN